MATPFHPKIETLYFHPIHFSVGDRKANFDLVSTDSYITDIFLEFTVDIEEEVPAWLFISKIEEVIGGTELKTENIDEVFKDNEYLYNDHTYTIRLPIDRKNLPLCFLPDYHLTVKFTKFAETLSCRLKVQTEQYHPTIIENNNSKLQRGEHLSFFFETIQSFLFLVRGDDYNCVRTINCGELSSLSDFNYSLYSNNGKLQNVDWNIEGKNYFSFEHIPEHYRNTKRGFIHFIYTQKNCDDGDKIIIRIFHTTQMIIHKNSITLLH